MNIPNKILRNLVEAKSVANIEDIIRSLPIVDPNEYELGYEGIKGEWKENFLHWLPVGLERGNGGRIKLAGKPENPLAERLVNAMEALIELHRQLELLKDPKVPCPRNPREAVARYFGLIRLDEIAALDKDDKKTYENNVRIARKYCQIYLEQTIKPRQFVVTIRDKGIGQAPSDMHKTLLSLGQSDKADKPYMIGVFGQGGSSTFHASTYSIIFSRRAPGLENGGGGIGWTIVRHIYPKGTRSNYFAYLAQSESGEVPFFSEMCADDIGFEHGSYFKHINYDFGGTKSSVARSLYPALNHVLFSPVLPYELYALRPEPELMQGTLQRLARQVVLRNKRGESVIDKLFSSQSVIEPI